MYRTFVILRHTFFETVLQPIYSLLIGIGAVILFIFAALPFFTLGEDTVMYKAVGLDVILILVLIITLFATSKSIYEEIEDRTMLTLMSKPVHKWQVLIGKYLGIITAALLAIAIMGVVISLSTWWRIPGDYQFNRRTIDEGELRQIFQTRLMHLAGLIPNFVLMWLQIAVLAAVSVAISTRVSLVVNLPVVILVYIAGNLTRFLFPIFGDGSRGLWEDRNVLVRGFAFVLGNVLPFLEVFDLRAKTIYSRIGILAFANDPNAVPYGVIWGYTGIALLYAIFYATFALGVGMLLFQTRELGGGEG